MFSQLRRHSAISSVSQAFFGASATDFTRYGQHLTLRLLSAPPDEEAIAFFRFL
jgi:hypothetical protein